MAVYRNRSRAIAERLVILRDYLYEHASPTNAVKISDILTHLASKDHKVKNYKTVYSDLKALEACFGLDLDYDERKKGYILKNPKFEPYELQIIVNSIQAFSFITQKEADRLTAKVRDELADESTRPSLDRQTLIPNRVRNINQDAMKGLNTIYEAIAQNRKISFKYLHYFPGIPNSKWYTEIDGSKIITVSPYKITLLEGKYAVIAVGKENGTERGYMLELEHMEQIKILADKREGESTAREKFETEFTNQKNISYTFGKTKLKVPYYAVESVMEKFGIDTVIMPDKGFMIAAINERPTPDLYIWTRTFRPPIEIVFPDDAEIKLRNYFLSYLRECNQYNPTFYIGISKSIEKHRIIFLHVNRCTTALSRCSKMCNHVI